MDSNIVLRHIVLSSVLSILCFASCYETKFGTNPASIALGSSEHYFKPPVAVPIIPKEHVSPDCTTPSINDKKIRKSIIVIISKGGIRAPSVSREFGSYPGLRSHVSKSAISIVPKKPVGFALAHIYNIQI